MSKPIDEADGRPRTAGAYPAHEGWAILHDVRIDVGALEETCPHAVQVADPEDPENRQVTVPRVVIAYTECHETCTYVCLDCILEAEKEERVGRDYRSDARGIPIG